MTITFRAKFRDGMQMDVKCCGVQYREGESNDAWAEAVLFDEHGQQVAYTEPEDTFQGKWSICYQETQYVCYVTEATSNDYAHVCVGRAI